MSLRIACAVVLLGSVLASCRLEVDVPADAQLTCGSIADCPGGFVCHNGRCVNAESVDTTPPDVASVTVSPAEGGRAGTTYTVRVEVKEDLATAPELTLLLEKPEPVICDATATSRIFTCSYTAVGHENGTYDGAVPVPHPFDLWMKDRAGNVTTRGLLGSLLMDFNPPSPASVGIAYRPAPSNPLPSVTRATAGTTVEVAVEANEPLDAGCDPAQPQPSCTLAASGPPGSAPLTFTLAASDTTSVRFRTTIPVGQPDGSYVPALSWADRLGNATGAPVALTVPIAVKTSRPALAVDQSEVTFVRSRWGNAAAEDLRRGDGSVGWTIPAGRNFELAPGDPLSPEPALAVSTFTAGATGLAAVRVWSDGGPGSLLLGTVVPDATGRWPRTPLQAIDTPFAWVSGVDDAGNESPPVQIASSEWVATANRPSFGVSPHAVHASFHLDEVLTPAGSTAIDPGNALEGLGGSKIVAKAGITLRQKLPGTSRPAARSMFGLTYDSGRGRVVLFGGLAAAGGALADTWEWDGTRWHDMTPATGSPSARYGLLLAYDSARGRVVLFGGGPATSSMTETWEWDGDAWTFEQRASEGLSTGGLWADSRKTRIAYDSVRERIVLHGVAGAGATWEWDGSRWERRWAGPTPQPVDFALAFDPRRGRTVLFGGETDQLWEWDGTSWTLATQSGALPGWRTGHTLAYDALLQQVVLWGGRDQSGAAASDLRAWDGQTWTVLPPGAAAGPSPRCFAGSAYDRARDRLVVWGGRQCASPFTQHDDTWELDAGGWELAAPRTMPPARGRHAVAYDAARGRLVLYGGDGRSGILSDVWEYDGRSWTDVTPAAGSPGPGRRYLHAMEYDPDAARVVVFGGLDATDTPRNDLWEWSGTAWTQRTTVGAAPSARLWHGMSYDPGRHVLVVFGGSSSWYPRTALGDLWELSNIAGEWRWTQRTSGPAARYNHCQVFEGAGTSVLFGYATGDALLYDGRSWSGTGWSTLALPSTYPHYFGLCARDPVRGKTMIFEFGSLAEWDGSGYTAPILKSQWEAVRRTNAAAAFDASRGRVVVFGGIDTDYMGDIFEIDADLVPGPAGPFQERTPMVQLTASYVGAGFTSEQVSRVRVRARAGGSFGGSGAGAELYGWRRGGQGFAPGQWVPLASNSDGTPLAAGAGLLVWSADTAASAFFIERDSLLAFQLRPAGRSGATDPEARVEADYVEVRVRYAVP